jgi:transcription initiation factor IIE alpha subunit
MQQATSFFVYSSSINSAALATDGHGRELGPKGIAVYCAVLSILQRTQNASEITLDQLSEITRIRNRDVGSILTYLSIAGILSIKKQVSKPSLITLLM